MNKKFLNSILVSLIINLAFSTTVLALTVKSEERQVFDVNQTSDELRHITITEDETSPVIKAGYIKLTIPNELSFIYNKGLSQENVRFNGSAINTKKIDTNTALEFADGDKSVKIEILEDFTAGEQLVISGLYVEGFHRQPTQSYNLILTNNDNSIQFVDVESKFVRTSNLSDSSRPEPVSDFSVKNTASGILLEWKDPTDLDINTIQILRGVNLLPVDARPYVEVGPNVESYLDTNVKAGDTVKYILKVSDGLNYSDNSVELSIEVTLQDQEEEQPVAMPDTELEETNTNEADSSAGKDNNQQPPFVTETPALSYEQEKDNAVEQGLVTIEFNKASNKCEAIVMIARAYEWEVDESIVEDGFSDTQAWCKPYAKIARDIGVIQGRTQDVLGAEGFISRFEVAVILVRLLRIKNLELSEAETAAYDDDIAEWANGAVNWLYKKSLMTGDNGLFRGNDSILKIEMGVLLTRLLAYSD